MNSFSSFSASTVLVLICMPWDQLSKDFAELSA